MFPLTLGGSSSLCPCKSGYGFLFGRSRSNLELRLREWRFRACLLPAWGGGGDRRLRRGAGGRKMLAVNAKHVSEELGYEGAVEEEEQVAKASSFPNSQGDPMVGKLRAQLGVMHPIPAPPINRNIVGFFAFFFFVGIVFDRLWTLWKKKKNSAIGASVGIWPRAPTSFSLLLEKDLQRKESVEWVNMVLGKLWKVYRSGLENWIVGLLQPVIDNLGRPDYVQRVEIKQFTLGDEPLSVRTVERRTSRRANDLQYQIGIRYTGGARLLLSVSLKFSIIPIVVPVGVRDFDVDGELWVKLRLIQSEPWVGAVSWAFVSLPKIKFVLSPFRLFNIMAIPVLSVFLNQLLTEDLPRLFVRPKRIVLDFQKGRAVGLVSNDLKNDVILERNKDFAGELSVTLVNAKKLAYVIFGKTDPYVILSLGDQEVRSKKNSQTTVIGRPGEPIWNQDFHMLVSNPKKQRLHIRVNDSFGFTDFTIGTGEIELGSLKDTVPTNRVVDLQGGLGLFIRQSSGEILLRLTYKAYVDDEDEDRAAMEFIDTDVSDDEMGDEKARSSRESEQERESFIDVLAALIVSEEFQGIVASEDENPKHSEETKCPEPILSKACAVGVDDDPPTASGMPFGVFGDSVIIWLAVVAAIAVIIALNVGDSWFFNP